MFICYIDYRGGIAVRKNENSCEPHIEKEGLAPDFFSHELCVCDLSKILGMEQSAVSHQLKTLRSAHLVKTRRDGKSMFYALDDAHISSILFMGLEHVREEHRHEND